MPAKGTAKIGNNGYGFSAEELKRRRAARNITTSAPKQSGNKLDKTIFGRKQSNGVTPFNPARFDGIDASARFTARRELREKNAETAAKGASNG